VREAPKLDTLPKEIASKVTYDEQKGEITFNGMMEESEKVALQHCFATPEAKASIERVYRKSRGLPAEEPTSSAERGEAFSIPLLSIKQGNLFEAFERTHFLDIAVGAFQV